MKRSKVFLLVILPLALVAILGLGLWYWRYMATARRSVWVMDWLRNPTDHQTWAVHAGGHCNRAPFSIPSDGFIGYLWDDSFRPGHRHQGIDIFGGGDVGITPVFAAYSGYLTRFSDWKSSVIIRIPQDPLQPDRQIWTYYTHMADQQGASLISDQFPPGSVEIYVSEGTLIGYQGNYSGDPGNPVGVHLHFSIVKDDGQESSGNAGFLNELDIRNTLDPTPYLGLSLNGNLNRGEIPLCKE